MSAIVGLYQTSGKPISIAMHTEMMGKLNKYPFDKSEIWFNYEVFFGCTAKYITPESIDEKLPYYDERTGLAITADAIIDNRTELLGLLNLSVTQGEVITDSQLILAAYIKWGDTCPNYLVGDFAFAIWDSRKKELFCARDHVGKRSFYYYYSDGIFAFCTVMKPLLVLSDDMKVINDAWIADFLSLPGVAHEFDCNQTIYKNIKQLLPAHSMKITSSGIKANKYWYPLNAPKIRFKTDEEYDEAFREVFGEAVRCRLRSIGPVGVMMSGGLDSGSVACMAAMQLAEKGQRLNAFSSIPFQGYKDWLGNTAVADESPYIEAIKEQMDNIDLTYISCQQKNSLTDVDRLIEMLEQPYKIVENLFWYDEIAKTAADKGCSVLLDGQFGNLTVSFGDFEVYMLSLFKSLKFVTMVREMKGYCKLYNISSLNVGKEVANTVLPYWLHKLITFIKREKYDLTDTLPINPELYKLWNVEERFHKEGWGIYPYPSYDLKQMRKRILRPQHYSHLGSLETKVSLEYGIAKRDPTKDKRVIEFCFGLPGNQFVRNGQERYLIRRSMKGILPDLNRLNYTMRGQQSADWIQRLVPEWDDTSASLREMLNNKLLKPYLDIHKLLSTLDKVQTSLSENMWGEIRMILISFIFGHFLLNNE